MKYIIDGSFLYGHIKGVQRYARQITKELDKYMADKPYEVEIAVPEIDSEGTSAEITECKRSANISCKSDSSKDNSLTSSINPKYLSNTFS